MRTVGLLALFAALGLAVGGWLLLRSGTGFCDAFASDLELAVTAPAKAPDPDDHRPVGDGSCAVTKTEKFDVHVPGLVDRHSDVTMKGSFRVSSGMDAGVLRRARSAAKEEPNERVTALSGLGHGAFLVTTTQPDAYSPSPDDSAVMNGEPTGLRVTAYWQRGNTFFTASATRDGATLSATERATARVAELLNRRQVRDLSP